MKRLITTAAAIAALLLKARFSTAGAPYAQKGGEKSKGGNDQVKLYSDTVEVVEVSEKPRSVPLPGVRLLCVFALRARRR